MLRSFHLSAFAGQMYFRVFLFQKTVIYLFYYDKALILLHIIAADAAARPRPAGE